MDARTVLLPFLLALVAVPPPPQATAKKRPDAAKVLAEAPKALETITAEDLRGLATKLAGPEMEGRLTGTPGQRKAAELFAERFKDLGLTPCGDKGRDGKRTYFQSYDVTLRGIEEEGSGLFDAKGKRLTSHGAWFLPRSESKKLEVRGKLVFAGTGDHEVDLRGAIGVFYLAIRDQEGPTNVYRSMGEGFRLMAQVRGLVRKAETMGAKACVLVSPTFPVSFLSAANMMTVCPGRPQVSLGSGRDRGMRFGGPGPSLPTVALAGADATAVLQALGLAAEVAFAKEDGLAVGTKSEQTCTLAAVHFSEKAEALNVCALLEGRDSRLKSEAVIYSAHMDHLGVAADGGAFFGADDDASGCATVLEIAEAYAKLPRDKRPRRSVLFLGVSGEELGLWGSEHFTENPTWPRDRIIADVNIDMIGRNTSRVPADTVALTPTYRLDGYSTLAQDAALLGEAFGLKMGNGDRFYQRSDHWNFAKHDIPVVFFCDDEHEDYHMPTDTPDKLDYEKMEKIGRLAFLIGYRAADDKSRPDKLGRQKDWF